jgi:phosphoribosylformylglycinamidine synthase
LAFAKWIKIFYMISFFRAPSDQLFVVQNIEELSQQVLDKLCWLFGNAIKISSESVDGYFIGPRKTMVTPWSTNAVEITQNMAISGIQRIEIFREVLVDFMDFDKMLQQKYKDLTQEIFTIDREPQPILEIKDIAAYNVQEGLALNEEEVRYLNKLSVKLGRKLTDSEVFGFSQVNSEHCRHKIFNGKFVIDGQEKPSSLFKLIKKTSQVNPNEIVSAYKDNVAFINGPSINIFAPEKGNIPSNYMNSPAVSILSLKAETHNFPTTVEPFNGAATGSGGEIRDRLGGGTGSLPLAGTAVYMTAYSRKGKLQAWEDQVAARKWLYQSPLDILIKASNGASDFGNKFGQPLISGSVLTFEHTEDQQVIGYDKVIMLAGGVGYGKMEMAQKGRPKKGDKIVVLGGDNYRIGMGGAAVSSADTGEFGEGIELNAVQRSNPEMQKRVANTIRALVEQSENPIISIHDHGAGGHLNCLSELVEEAGGQIDVNALPIGDPTLSYKELIGNESQERMGLVIDGKDLPLLNEIALRERAPMYVVGEVTGDDHFSFVNLNTGEKPIDLDLADMFGSSPETVMTDKTIDKKWNEINYIQNNIYQYTEAVLRLEGVACKDWLTNKVDRCVGGLVATQQCVGELQVPLNNCGVMALDFNGVSGVATSIGHDPVGSLISAPVGARNSIGEALTNIIWAPLEKGIKSVSLSANWMWPCKNPGEDARLYSAVEAASTFAIELGINIPTGKDSLSMAQRYSDQTVLAPGTVIISAAGHCIDVKKVIEPVLKVTDQKIYYINMSNDQFKLGGSSLGQVLSKVGSEVPDIKDSQYFVKVFNHVQKHILHGVISSGHDISSGGLLTTLLEMCFPSTHVGADLDLSQIPEQDLVKLLFSENAGIVFQATQTAVRLMVKAGINVIEIGKAKAGQNLSIKINSSQLDFDIPTYRKIWYETSYELDTRQTKPELAKERFLKFDQQPLKFLFPKHFTGKLSSWPTKKIQAAIIREQGSNSEREMANAMHRVGFEVRDVHMTDLVSGRETLEDVHFLGAVGGFSNSDVLGSAKGWAGSFKYNEKAKTVLNNFFKRADTLSIGICNGCQLFLELDMINPDHEIKSKMYHNESGKHESTFTSVEIGENNSVMMQNLAGSRLGVWISHGEGKFHLPLKESNYNIVAKYGYDQYPANPNGSDYNTAMLCSDDGRHLVTMPHIERSFNQWNWAHYPEGRNDEVSPWALAFVNARQWLEALD